jgi:hypothetical protein
MYIQCKAKIIKTTAHNSSRNVETKKKKRKKKTVSSPLTFALSSISYLYKTHQLYKHIFGVMLNRVLTGRLVLIIYSKLYLKESNIVFMLLCIPLICRIGTKLKNKYVFIHIKGYCFKV